MITEHRGAVIATCTVRVLCESGRKWSRFSPWLRCTPQCYSLFWLLALIKQLLWNYSAGFQFHWCLGGFKSTQVYRLFYYFSYWSLKQNVICLKSWMSRGCLLFFWLLSLSDDVGFNLCTFFSSSLVLFIAVLFLLTAVCKPNWPLGTLELF